MLTFSFDYDHSDPFLYLLNENLSSFLFKLSKTFFVSSLTKLRLL